MRAPLFVRINDGVTDRLMSKRITGLRWRKTAPGGHADASCRIDLPASTFSRLGPNDRMWVYDKDGRTLFDGYTNNPGTQSGRDGEAFELSALGGMSLASDRSEPAIYVDFSFDGWERATDVVSAASASTDVSTRPSDGIAALLCQLNPGQPVVTNSRARMTYNSLSNGGLKLGGIDFVLAGGSVDAGYTAGIDVTNSAGSISSVTGGSATLTTTAGVFNKYAPASFTADARKVSLQIYRNGAATNVATDDKWATGTSLRIAMQRVDKYGATVVLTTASTVLASEVAADLLGRILTMCDPATSTIDTTTYQITNLAYKDGVTAAQALDDLALYEPDMLWEILETGPSGLHEFNYRAWPTVPRYIIPPSMRVERTGGDVDLCNRIAVNWVDPKGKPMTTVIGAYVPDLGDKNPILAGALDPTFVGRIRDAEPVTLPDGRGSLDNATRIGEQILAAKADPPEAGKVVVDRPIVDAYLGRPVQPWELDPGYIARDMTTGNDLRVTEVEYEDDSCSATLSLGEPVLTSDQRIAQLAKYARSSK